MNGDNSLNDIIGKLTENPEMMKSLMNIAGNIMNDNGASLKNMPKEEYEEYGDGDKSKEVFSYSEKSGERGGFRYGDEHKKGNSRRKRGDDAENLIRLLCALKPYVSDDRVDKIDSVIKILKVVQLSEKTGLLKSLL